MSGLSMGEKHARGFCLPISKKTRGCGRLLILVDGLAKTLAGGEGRNGLRRNLDLLAVHRAAPGARLPGPRKKRAEADDGDALSFRDVGDDRVEKCVHHFVGCYLADVPRFCRNLDQIGLGHHVWHAFSLDLLTRASRHRIPNRNRKTIMIRLTEEDIMKRLVISALAAAAFSLPAHAQSTLTFSSWVPPTHHLTIWQANWAAEVEKATSGRVKFQQLPKHPSAPPGTFDAVRDGLMDLSYVTASYTPARHILPLMAELPGAGETAEINSVAYSRIHWKHFHKLGEYKGVKLLAVWTHGPGQMFTKKPIKSLADFQNQKIRTGGGISAEVISALGGSPFFKPAPESYELLNSGVADGVFFPFESIVSFKLDKVIGQATVFPGGLYSSSFGFFMNQDKWSKLAKQDQAIIEKHGYEYAARSNGQSWDKADQVGLAALKAAGANIVTADAAMQAEAKKRSGPIIEDWIKKASAKGVDAKAILAEFHAELKKVAAERK